MNGISLLLLMPKYVGNPEGAPHKWAHVIYLCAYNVPVFSCKKFTLGSSISKLLNYLLKLLLNIIYDTEPLRKVRISVECNFELQGVVHIV